MSIELHVMAFVTKVVKCQPMFLFHLSFLSYLYYFLHSLLCATGLRCVRASSFVFAIYYQCMTDMDANLEYVLESFHLCGIISVPLNHCVTLNHDVPTIGYFPTVMVFLYPMIFEVLVILVIFILLIRSFYVCISATFCNEGLLIILVFIYRGLCGEHF